MYTSANSDSVTSLYTYSLTQLIHQFYTIAHFDFHCQ